MTQLVGDLSAEERLKLGAIHAGDHGGVLQVLNDRHELPGQIVIETVDERRLVHEMHFPFAYTAFHVASRSRKPKFDQFAARAASEPTAGADTAPPQ